MINHIQPLVFGAPEEYIASEIQMESKMAEIASPPKSDNGLRQESKIAKAGDVFGAGPLTVAGAEMVAVCGQNYDHHPTCEKSNLHNHLAKLSD